MTWNIFMVLVLISGMTENEISYEIRGAAFKVYNKLGPGLLESVYEKALMHELDQEGFKVKAQLCIDVIYDDLLLEKGFRIDLLVEEKVVVEIKSVECLNALHKKQLLTYLRITGLKLGLLINFNSENINKSIYRVVNKL